MAGCIGRPSSAEDERRGLVLIDPPFEKPEEFDTILRGIEKAIAAARRHLRHLVPDQEGRRGGALPQGPCRAPTTRHSDIRLTVRAPTPEPRLHGCGMVIVNPPYLLESRV